MLRERQGLVVLLIVVLGVAVGAVAGGAIAGSRTTSYEGVSTLQGHAASADG